MTYISRPEVHPSRQIATTATLACKERKSQQVGKGSYARQTETPSIAKIPTLRPLVRWMRATAAPPTAFQQRQWLCLEPTELSNRVRRGVKGFRANLEDICRDPQSLSKVAVRSCSTLGGVAMELCSPVHQQLSSVRQKGLFRSLTRQQQRNLARAFPAWQSACSPDCSPLGGRDLYICQILRFLCVANHCAAKPLG